MKRLSIFLMAFFCILFNVQNVKANSYNGGSIGRTPSHKECPRNGKDPQWCTWNNAHHVTIEVQLYHYNGGGSDKRTKISNAIILTDNNFAGLSDVYSFDNSIKISKTSKGAFPIDSLTKYFTTRKTLGITLHELLPNLKYSKKDPGATVDAFAKWAADNYSSKWDNNFHSKMGGDYGFRLVLRPLVSFVNTSTKKIKFMDASSILECYNDKKCLFTNSDYPKTLPCSMYVTKKDVGYSGQSGCSVNPDNAKTNEAIRKETSNIGLNIVDFDKDGNLIKTPLCDPKKTYNKQKGVEKCCMDMKLTYSNYPNFEKNDKNPNTVGKSYSYVKSKITRNQLKGTKCDDRCNTNTKNGIINCCQKKYKITSYTDSKNNEDLLTKKISKDNIEAYCNLCTKTPDGIKKCCAKHNFDYSNQKNNLGKYFFDGKPATAQQLKDNCDNRCNPDKTYNGESGKTYCCRTRNIKMSTLKGKNNNTKDLTRLLTEKDIKNTECDDRCNPDKTYNGVDGVTYCCKTKNITYKKQGNNTLLNLTRTLEKDEMLDKCNKKCDTSKESNIGKCCTNNDITYLDQTNNTTDFLTEKISEKNLLKYCDTRCKTDTVDGIKACCKEKKISIYDLKNNNDIELTQPISYENIVKYCGEEKKCDPNIDGIKTCCDRFDITTDDRSGNNLDNLTEKLTDEQIESVCYDYDCENDIVADLPSNCNDSSFKDDEGNTIEVPGNNEGGIYDNTSWKCVFESSNCSEKSVKDAYIADAGLNPYCTVYCKQNMNVEFPLAGTETTQGRFLTVNYQNESSIKNNINPIDINADVECRTTGEKGDIRGKIDKEKFLKAYATYDAEYVKWSKMINSDSDIFAYLAKKAKNDRDKQITYMKECISQIKNANTNITPNLKFHYDDPVDLYEEDYNLVVSSEERNEEKSGNVFAKSGSDSIEGNMDGSLDVGDRATVYETPITYNECNRSNCTTKTAYYPNTTWYYLNFEKDVKYGLPKDTNRYVAKSNYNSFSKKVIENEEYIDIGHANLPIHYSALPGKYNYSISIDISDKNNFLNRFEGLSTTYTCDYRVTCEKLLMIKDCDKLKDLCPTWYEKYSCENGVLSAIYRTISLYEGQAFLTETGEERKPGYNWSLNDYPNDLIYNNRNTEDYGLYDLDPMYEITLTPATLKTIRKYNDSMNKKEVSGYGIYKDEKLKAGYTSYIDMDCTSGEHCLSKMIRTWGANGCAIEGNTYKNCGPEDKVEEEK